MFGLTVLGIAGMVGLDLAGCRFLIDPASPVPASAYGGVNVIFWGFGISLLGLLIVLHRPGNRIGWLTLTLGLFGVLNFLFVGIDLCSEVGGRSLPEFVVIPRAINVTGWALVSVLGFFLMTFPNGQFLSNKWKGLSATALVLMAAYLAISLVFNTSTDPTIFSIPLFVFPLLGIVSLVFRWRNALGDERQQIKWLVFFISSAGTLFFAVEIFGTLAYPAIFQGWFYLFNLSLFFLGFPIVLGLSIFKYRLYDIDIIIRRTLSYAMLTGVLALFYFGSVVVLQTLFTTFTGGQSPAAVVVSTLAIAALFNPLRTRIQDLIDRRFNRARYDAALTLASFALAARNEVDLTRLSHALIRVVEDTVQPEETSLWLRE